MATNTTIDLPIKPKVLIADDSRIVRAMLIKHIEGLFEFKEALDGEQAWESLLLDPQIRVVITDLTMPKLDGYGLLRRIRGSKVPRIRDIPVIVVSGSDEQEERDRAKAAGANDLITKGIDTTQLLSRLDILSKLVNTQHELERSLETLVQNAQPGTLVPLSSPEVQNTQAEEMLVNAMRQNRNFLILNACIGLKQGESPCVITSPPINVVSAIGQLFRRTVRQTDHVAQTGEAEFTLVTGGIHFDSARSFAQRVCGAIVNANLVKDRRQVFIASCGLFSRSEYGAGSADAAYSWPVLRDIAHRRAVLGLKKGITGVVGAEEEAILSAGTAIAGMRAQYAVPEPGGEAPDFATLLRWVKEGRKEQVMQHIGSLSTELQPLLDLLAQQAKL